MRVLIIGASGFIGRHLVAALTKAGHDVVCCVRHPARAERLFPGVPCIAGDFSRDCRASDWIPRLSGIEAVVNAAGIIRERRGQSFDALHRDGPIALFEACVEAGVRRVVQISALGADDQAKSRFHLSKKAADDHLAGLDLDWVILQPSIVLGAGGQSARLFSTLAALPVIPLIGNGRQMIQPISVHDLAQAVAHLVEPTAPSRVRLAAVGPEPISIQDLLERMRRRMGLRRSRSIRLPLPLMRLLARLGDRLGSRSLTTENLEMLLRGNTADSKRFVGPAGFRKPLTPPEEAWRGGEAPATAHNRGAELREARLAVLGPILRLSIAFIWIATGLISALVYPVSGNYELLARVGITGALAPVMLYATSGLEVVLGLATLVGYRIRLVGFVQLGLIAAFSVIIALWLPEFWAHPFGPLIKNVPVAAATLVMIALEERA